MTTPLKIPFGNDFRLYLCGKNIAPADEDATLADIVGLKACLRRYPYQTIDVAHELTECGDIIISVTAEEANVRALYSLKLKGNYNGYAWQYTSKPLFSIVEANATGDVQYMETYGPDTYYIDDVVEAETSGNCLCLDSHSRVTLKDGVLTITNNE